MNIVSGMRPTGQLHLGHYLGVLKNWVELQKENSGYYFVADYHALSTSYEDGLNLRKLSLGLVRDWLSGGLDPEKSTIFVQSAVPQHAELYVILNMITPLGWLERNPTYKDQIQQLQGKDINSGGFLTYPVLQGADILLYDADAVPIGEDQRPHLEIAREIVRRFSHLFGEKVFLEPKEILSETPKLLGLDGRKMSKSYGNSIYLSETSDEVWQKLRTAKTDTNRVRKTDKGNPDVCLVFDYHKEFSSKETVAEMREGCEAGSIGCVQCKKSCLKSIDSILDPMRERREKFSDSDILDILESGNKKARETAKAKMEIVNRAVFERD
ncbi:tryptophanyl-tRNA synthetase [Thiovulum sp. ES]|nr:tryptophanyl-tRNA synthetase [Thiovulum sp. ES]